MKESIFNNIIGLHDLSGRFGDVVIGHSGTISWVYNKPNYWPSSIIGNPDIEAIPEIASQMEEGKLPPLLILSTSIIKDQSVLLKELRLREVDRWEGMSLERSRWILRDRVVTGLSIRKAATEIEMLDWLNVVKQVLMINKNISEVLLDGFLHSNQVSMYVGYYDDMPVATGLQYVDKGISGLYFISTLPAYQKKGFATVMVSKMIQESFESGIKEIILHASAAGKKLYLNLGFVPDESISVLWKIGKF